jgi:hypothetical protein
MIDFPIPTQGSGMFQKIQIKFIFSGAVVMTHTDLIQRPKVKIHMMIIMASVDFTEVCYLF